MTHAPRGKLRRLARTAGVLILLQALLFGAYFLIERPREPARGGRLRVGDVLPPLALVTVDGARADHPSPEKPMLVHFWATWCEPCRNELPSLIRFGGESEAAFVLVAVSVDADSPAIRDFFDGNVPSVVTRAAEADAHARFGGSTLPDTYLFGSDRRLLARFEGARDWSQPKVRETLLTQLRPHSSASKGPNR